MKIERIFGIIYMVLPIVRKYGGGKPSVRETETLCLHRGSSVIWGNFMQEGIAYEHYRLDEYTWLHYECADAWNLARKQYKITAPNKPKTVRLFYN